MLVEHMSSGGETHEVILLRPSRCALVTEALRAQVLHPAGRRLLIVTKRKEKEILSFQFC